MQVAGLISALMAMIVTLWLGFLLESLPTVTTLTCFTYFTRGTKNNKLLQHLCVEKLCVISG